MKLSELITKIVQSKRNPIHVSIINAFKEEIGQIKFDDYTWELESDFNIDVFQSDIVEISFYPVLKTMTIMIYEVML